MTRGLSPMQTPHDILTKTNISTESYPHNSPLLYCHVYFLFFNVYILYVPKHIFIMREYFDSIVLINTCCVLLYTMFDYCMFKYGVWTKGKSLGMK